MRATRLCILVGLLTVLPRPSRAEDALTADRAVQLAQARNGELRALATEIDAADARLRGASLLFQANPELSASVGSRWGEGATRLEYEAGVSQQLELFGQRGARIDVARANKSVAELRLKARRAELAAEVREAFAQSLATEQFVQVAEENVALARETARAAARKLEVGDGSRIEVNTARIDLGRSTRELNGAIQERTAAHSTLKILLGLEPTTVMHLAGDLSGTASAASLDPELLARRAMVERAEVAAARHAVEAAHAEQRFAERDALPRPRLGARYERDEGDHIVLGTLDLDLPVFNQNQAGKGVAAAEAAQAELAFQSIELRVRQQVALAAVRLQAAQDAARSFGRDVVEAATENLALVGTAYEAGKIDLFEVLLIRRNALESRRGYIESQLELRTAEAELAKALGSAEGRL